MNLKKHVFKVGSLFLSFALVGTVFSPLVVNAEEGTPATETPTTETTEEIAPLAADVTKPVIDEVIFPGKGTTVKVGDKLPVSVKAHDADSGIKEVYVSYEFVKEDESIESYWGRSLTFNQTTGLYEGEIEVPTPYESKFISGYIEFVKVVDDFDNYTLEYLYDENYDYSHTFVVDDETFISAKEVPLKSVSLTPNQQTITATDKLTFKALFDSFTEENVLNYSIIFEHEDGYTSEYFNYNSETISNEIISDLELSRLEVGKYTFKEIYVIAESNARYKLTYPNAADIWFEYTEENDGKAPVIESIQMTKNGETLKAGDKVELTIKATDDTGLDYESAYAYFYASADINDSSKDINLVYDETAKAFKGTFEITENTYPCEWYLGDVNIFDVYGNQVENNFYEDNYPYYVNVVKDGTFTSETFEVEIRVNTLNNNGNYRRVSTLRKENVERRTTFKELGLTLPDPTTTFGGLKFVGWVDEEGNPFDENTVFVNWEYIDLYAKYDKKPITLCTEYINSDMQYQVDYTTYAVPHEYTFAQLVQDYKKYAPTNQYASGFKGWVMDKPYYVDEEDENWQEQVIPLDNFTTYAADYGDQIPLIFANSYIGKDGKYHVIDEVKFVNKGTKFGEYYNILTQKAAPETYEGTTFKQWKIDSYTEKHQSGINVYPYTILRAYAECDKEVIRVLIDPMFDPDYVSTDSTDPSFVGLNDEEEYEYFKVIAVAKVGDKVKIPVIEGYENLKYANQWLGDEEVEVKTGFEFTVEEGIDFYAYGAKTGETAEEKAKHLSEETIKTAVDQIKKAETGKTVKVDMGKATIVPEEILETIKGKEVNLELNFGGYTWTINGKNVLSSKLKDIDLEVRFDKNAIPSKTVSKLAGNNPVQQLSLTHNGDFGFKAQLSFNLDKKHAGKYGNLYYYDSDGKLVYQNAGKIAADGKVTLNFSHASDYVVIIKSSRDGGQSPDTSDSMNTTMYLGMMALSACALVISKKRRNA